MHRLPLDKECSRCERLLPLSEFPPRKGGKFGLYRQCRECKKAERREDSRKYRAAHPEERRRSASNVQLRRRYGISLADYDEMFTAQGGLCAICRRPESKEFKGVVTRLAVDHDHRTGAIRALLCVTCNLGLGNFGEDPERMAAAISYLGGFHA